MAAELPKKTELVMFHGMSALQKKYYKALLMKDLGERQFSTSPLLSSCVCVCVCALLCVSVLFYRHQREAELIDKSLKW